MNPPRRLSAALVLTLALAACTTGGEGLPVTGEGGPASGKVGGAGGGGGGTGVQTPAGITPAEYGTALAAAMGPVGSALKDIAKSRSLKSLGGRVERASGAAGAAVDRLSAVTSPPDVTNEHADLLAALRGLEGDLEAARESVDGRGVCTAPAVLARLGKGEGIGAVRSAGDELASRGDYPADIVDVKIPKEQTRRLSNGAVIRSGTRGGLGRVTVKNGNSQDAVVTLVRGKRKGTSFYIRKKSKTTIRSVPDGSYKVYYTTGSDYDRGRRTFTRNCAFKRFEGSIRFRTTYSNYTIWTLTLNAIKGGNTRADDVDPDDFPS